MNLLKDIKKLNTQHILLLVGILLVGLYLSNYSSNLGSLLSGMNNPTGAPGANGANGKNGANGATVNQIKAAMPGGMNSGPGPAHGVQQITGGFKQNNSDKLSSNPADLLPKDNNGQWGGGNPSSSGEVLNVNLLKAGFHTGIDTVGSSLRNANLQIRSEPPNPRQNTGPWNSSTIEPDEYRRNLELGAGQ